MDKANSVGLVIMVGGGSRGVDVERALRRSRQCAARDLLVQAFEIPQLSPIIVLSDDPDWLATLDGPRLFREPTNGDRRFHFGHTLTEVTKRYQLSRCLYFGGGSAPLLSSSTLAQVTHMVLAEAAVLVTNNIHSSDWVGYGPTEALFAHVSLLERDNALAWVWQEKTGYPAHALPRSSATQLDIDTPFDLLVLQRHGETRPHLRSFLDQLVWPADHLDAAVRVLGTEASQVVVAGRLSSWIWGILEQRTRAWIRVFAEERGMRASGRQAHGVVKSLLNDYLDLVGVEDFFVRLSTFADAVLLDSRVILASRGLWPSDADRFHSDLLMYEDINDPFLRALTKAARESPVPVVLGGHSLVAGGLAALLEGAGFVAVQ